MHTAPPTVQMLWENADPQVVITDRFGFVDAAGAAEWVARTVGAQWGLEIRGCERIVMSGDNALAWCDSSAGPLIAKWSVDARKFARLGDVARVVSHLGRSDLPVSAPIPTADGRVQVEVDGALLGLQHRFDGEILDVGDPLQVRAAGATLARLHQGLGAYPDAPGIRARRASAQGLRGRIRPWLEDDRPQVPPRASAVLAQAVEDVGSDDLPVQLLHGDYRSTNILWSGDAVSAVLDFDEMRCDHRIDELARAAVLLGTRFREWEPVTVAVRSEFLAGYESVSPLDAAEARWWPVLVLWYCLAMIPAGEDPSGWARDGSGWVRAAMDELAATWGV